MDPAAKEIIVRQGRLYTEKILSAIKMCIRDRCGIVLCLEQENYTEGRHRYDNTARYYLE